MLPGLSQQQRESVFRLANRTQQIGLRRAHGIVIGLALDNGRLIDIAGQLHRFHHPDGQAPVLDRLLGDFQLTVEHQQRIIAGSYARNHLRANGSQRRLALKPCGLGSPLRIEQFAEQIDFPAGRQRKRIGLLQRPVLNPRQLAARRQRKRRNVGQTSRSQLRLIFLHDQRCRQQVDIAGQPLFDQRLQLRIGEHLLPRPVPEVDRIARKRVGDGNRVAVQSGRLHLRPAVGTVNIAAAHHHRRTRHGQQRAIFSFHHHCSLVKRFT